MFSVSKRRRLSLPCPLDIDDAFIEDSKGKGEIRERPCSVNERDSATTGAEDLCQVEVCGNLILIGRLLAQVQVLLSIASVENVGDLAELKRGTNGLLRQAED